MATHAANVILHPVRIRIVLETAGNELTASEVAQRLPDIPQATLYRHLARLIEAGVLQIVAERRVRGGVERTFRLISEKAQLGPDDAASLTPDKQVRGFVAFVGTLVEAFARYVRHPDAAVGSDPLGYRQVSLWLTDEETALLVDDLRGVLGRYAPLEQAPGRHRVRLSTIMIPDPPAGDASQLHH